jgi:hypothetical protein
MPCELPGIPPAIPGTEAELKTGVAIGRLPMASGFGKGKPVKGVVAYSVSII